VPVTVPRARAQRGRKLGAFFEHLLMRLLCGLLSRGLVRLAILWRLGQGFDRTIGLLAEHRLPQRVVHRYAGWIYLATDVQHAIETADLRGSSDSSAHVEHDIEIAKPMPKIMRVFIASPAIAHT